MKKVCIIGAGAAGLAAIRAVAESPCLDGVVFEQSDTIGGLWVYSDSNKDDFGQPLHSSMYKSLRTHLPKQLMGYPDFPFGETAGSFLTHKDMIKYMKEYVSHYKLERFIKFQHRVDDVKLVDNLWIVSVKNTLDGTISLHEFDSVIVCNGHCFKPQPSPGYQAFQGVQIHSRDYRKPEIFAHKNVLVVGGGLSALDLSIEIASTANRVIYSQKGKHLDHKWFPKNVFQTLKVRLVRENSVVFENGDEAEIDVIVFCTGFVYYFPFMSLPELQVVDGKYVKPLYRHCIHSKHPSLSFIGIPFLNAAFPLFHCQAKYYVKYLEGSVQLPSEEEMNRQIEYDFNLKKNNGLPISKAHSMENDPWEYYKTLGDEAGFETKWIPLMRSIYNNVNERRSQFPTLYKQDKIIGKSPNEYEYIAIEEEIIEQQQ